MPIAVSDSSFEITDCEIVYTGDVAIDISGYQSVVIENNVLRKET
jgi:hypothetical protein